MSVFSHAFSKAVAVQRQNRIDAVRQARAAKLAAEQGAYNAGYNRHEDLVRAVAAIATPAIAVAVRRDPRVVALARQGGETYNETLDALVWAPSEPTKINQTLSAIFGHRGVLDQVTA